MKLQFDPNLSYQQEAEKAHFFRQDRREGENDKIVCGKAHFGALQNEVHFLEAEKMNDIENAVER